MKNLRIGPLLVFLMLAGAWLSASENVRLENDQQLTPKTAQADTVRMTWVVKHTSSSQSFYFNGEDWATYKVDWGDGKTGTYRGIGANYRVSCGHSYSTKGTYTVLLYGVASEEK